MIDYSKCDGDCFSCPYLDFVQRYDRLGRPSFELDAICTYVENSAGKTVTDLEKQGKE